jgi:hypothetical protein
MGSASRILLDAGFRQEAVTLNICERKAGVARDIANESQDGYTAVIAGRRGLSK